MAQAQEKVVNGVKVRDIRGKDYVEVVERVKQAHEKSESFELIESEPFEIAGRVVWRVTVLVNGKTYKGNAEVKLSAPKNTPDGTNPFECAETSAVGRALGFAGLGTIDSIASYDEIARSQSADQRQTTNKQPEERPAQTPPAKSPEPAASTQQSAQKPADQPVQQKQPDPKTPGQMRKELQAQELMCLVNGEEHLIDWKMLVKITARDLKKQGTPLSADKILAAADDAIPPHICKYIQDKLAELVAAKKAQQATPEAA